MRYFNTHGPVNAAEHYVVARRALVEGLVAQIEQDKYFTIYAPRQMGKRKKQLGKKRNQE